MRDEPSQDASLDYCSGCGVCTQVCPQGVHIAEINTQARAAMRERTGFKPRDRLLARPDVIGRLSTPVAPVVNLTLRSAAAAFARRAAHGTRPPRRAAGVSGADVPGLGPQARLAARRAPRRLLPRLRGELVRAAHGRDDGAAARVARLPGRRAARPEVLWAARAVQRHVRPRAALRAADGADARAVRARRRRHRRDVDELHADAQARGARDPRPRRRRRPAGGQRARVRHLRVPRDAGRPRRAADRLRAAPADRHLPRARASSRATGSASRRST